MKRTNAYKRSRLYYIINTVYLLHVSATLVAILREMHYKDILQKFLNQCTNIRYYVSVFDFSREELADQTTSILLYFVHVSY